MKQEGLCSSCNEIVVPEEVRDQEGHLEALFCPICGNEYFDTKEE